MTKLEQAIALAALGFRVFPLQPDGKKPIWKEWQIRASNDPEQIRRWWVDPVTGWEQDHNIGVTGGLFLDIDAKNGVDGVGSFFDLLAAGELPPTMEVTTPTGGTHFYFRADDRVRNSASKLGPGLDVRSLNGYVVGPGSTIGGKEYRIIHRVDSIPPCPEWLIRMAGGPGSTARKAAEPRDNSPEPGVHLDNETDVLMAIEYLRSADPAIAHEGGDFRTVRTAFRVGDFGISEPKCLDLMLDHYNPRCEPPWTPEEMAVRVRNAYRYRHRHVGASSVEADFDPVYDGTEAAGGNDKKDEPKAPDPLTPQPVVPFDFATLPRRKWVLGTLLLKGQLSVMIAPPGTGKSTLALQAAVAIVTGRNDLTGMPVRERQRVWIYNNEDSKEEMNRRLAAVMIQFGVTWEDLKIEGKPGLFMNSGAEVGLKVARRKTEGRMLVAVNVQKIAAFCLGNQIGVICADPFIETHEATENSNEEIALAARAFRRIAQDGHCAVLVVHHTNKPPGASSEGRPGDMNSGRGASSLMGVARIAVTFYEASTEAAKKYGIKAEERDLYLRLDDAKANMALISKDPKWLRRTSVAVPDEETAIDLKMESVGVLVPVELAKPGGVDAPNMLVEDVISIFQGKESVLSLAKRLKAECEMHKEKGILTIREAIMEAFRERVLWEDKAFQIYLGEYRGNPCNFITEVEA